MGLEKTPLRTLANEDGAAILDARSGQITTLNTTGAFVWQALQRGDSTDAIVSNLARDTGEDLSTVKEGVAAFLTELAEHHLWSF